VKGLGDGMWSLLWGIIIIAIVYMLVKPGSVASTAVKDIGTAMTNIVTSAVS
jgi:hypothetical protein